MRLSILITLIASASAFTASTRSSIIDSNVKLDMASRRGVLETLAVGTLFVPSAAGAFSQQLDDFAYEPQQQATNGKVDLNAAFVGEYKNFPGMFPHAAGKIGSNGPYKKVKDIYSITDLSDHDIAMFRKYDKYFTAVYPPGRSFYERINSRMST